MILAFNMIRFWARSLLCSCADEFLITVRAFIVDHLKLNTVNMRPMTFSAFLVVQKLTAHSAVTTKVPHIMKLLTAVTELDEEGRILDSKCSVVLRRYEVGTHIEAILCYFNRAT